MENPTKCDQMWLEYREHFRKHLNLEDTKRILWLINYTLGFALRNAVVHNCNRCGQMTVMLTLLVYSRHYCDGTWVKTASGELHGVKLAISCPDIAVFSSRGIHVKIVMFRTHIREIVREGQLGSMGALFVDHKCKVFTCATRICQNCRNISTGIILSWNKTDSVQNLILLHSLPNFISSSLSSVMFYSLFRMGNNSENINSQDSLDGRSAFCKSFACAEQHKRTKVNDDLYSCPEWVQNRYSTVRAVQKRTHLKPSGHWDQRNWKHVLWMSHWMYNEWDD
jgi:hypothetical protein